MAPRPFMVERGHNDPVGFDHWVAYEYAPVRRFYTLLGILERTEIEFFDGVHEIRAEGTFRFLHRHLVWPECDLVLLPFPFTDLRSSKQRPCLILSALRPCGLPEHLVVAMITSQRTGLSFPGDTPVTAWQEAGLPLPSLVRLAKLVTVERSLVRRKLGTLDEADRHAVRRQFLQVFAELI
jgi:mRNA-degrading endonuclease toxin of MazEF toxin-antitoxin module